MTQKGCHSPKRRNTTPPLQLFLIFGTPASVLTTAIISTRRKLVMMRSRQITVQFLKRQLDLLEIIPVIILRSHKRNENRVYNRRHARSDRSIDTGEDLSRRCDGNFTTEVRCSPEPDGHTCCKAEDRRENCGGFALATPEDCEDHWEDSGTCNHTY
jgi:hypothetical protein